MGFESVRAWNKAPPRTIHAAEVLLAVRGWRLALMLEKQGKDAQHYKSLLSLI